MHNKPFLSDMILFMPKWYISLRPGISIASYPWLSMSSRPVVFVPASIILLQVSHEKNLPFFFHLIQLTCNAVRESAVRVMLFWSFHHAQATSIFSALLLWRCPILLSFDQ